MNNETIDLILANSYLVDDIKNFLDNLKNKFHGGKGKKPPV